MMLCLSKTISIQNQCKVLFKVYAVRHFVRCIYISSYSNILYMQKYVKFKFDSTFCDHVA